MAILNMWAITKRDTSSQRADHRRVPLGPDRTITLGHKPMSDS